MFVIAMTSSAPLCCSSSSTRSRTFAGEPVIIRSGRPVRTGGSVGPSSASASSTVGSGVVVARDDDRHRDDRVRLGHLFGWLEALAIEAKRVDGHLRVDLPGEGEA